MARKPLLLDLFCGAGGAAVGYARAGFRVVGVDCKPQPRYPFEFVQQDALWILDALTRKGSLCPTRYWLQDFAAIHASPPCQRYSWASFTKENKDRHQDLVAPTRSSLDKTGLAWVIENVVPSPLGRYSITLCGLMFGLKVFRHRRFESPLLLFSPSHPTHREKLIGANGMSCVVGHGGGVSRRMRQQCRRLNRDGSGGQQTKAEWASAMGIDWMTRDELAQAIPPAYTEYVGRQLIRFCS